MLMITLKFLIKKFSSQEHTMFDFKNIKLELEDKIFCLYHNVYFCNIAFAYPSEKVC